MKNYNIYPLGKDNSYWDVRNFLRQVWRISEIKTQNWNVARLDYFKWHVFMNCFEKDFDEHIYIISEDNDISGVIISDSPGGYQIQVHPKHPPDEVFKTALHYLENSIVPKHEIKRLHIPIPDGDAELEQIMKDAGFSPTEWLEVRRETIIPDKPFDIHLPTGYKIRSLGTADELPARSWASWRAFHPNEPDEKYEGWKWYQNIQKSPLYRRDLDLVCTAPDDSIAGFVTLWYDDFNRTVILEPVGVVPEHLHKSLGSALINEGFIRAKKLGAVTAYVDSYEEPAHSLYEKMGLKSVQKLRTWEKK